MSKKEPVKLPHTSTIAADLNTFKRMASAVDFAVQVAENLQALQSETSDMKKQKDSLTSELSGLRSDVMSAKNELRDAKAAAKKAGEDATAEGARIIQQARNEASTIRSTANSEADSVKRETAAKRDKIEQLNKDIKALGEQKASAQKEVDSLTGRVETALSNMKK